MASPIETIKQGIEAGDWKKVVSGYNRLSGEKMKAPKVGGIVTEMKVEDIPSRVKMDLVRPWIETIRQTISNLSEALDNDGEVSETATDTEHAEDDDSEDEDEESYDFAPAEPEVTTESRASNARAILRGDKEVPDFTHVHSGTTEADEHPELGKKCRTEPFKPGTFHNAFTDDGKLHRDDKDVDKKLNKGLRPSGRRPPVKKVKVTCFNCKKDYVIDPALAPQEIKGAGDKPSFVCDGCRKRVR